MIARLFALLVAPAQVLAAARSAPHRLPARTWRRHSALIHYGLHSSRR